MSKFTCLCGPRINLEKAAIVTLQPWAPSEHPAPPSPTTDVVYTWTFYLHFLLFSSLLKIQDKI